MIKLRYTRYHSFLERIPVSFIAINNIYIKMIAFLILKLRKCLQKIYILNQKIEESEYNFV